MRRAQDLALLAAGLAALASPALAGSPTPVSPLGAVEQGCPTFSWAAVASAPAYDLVVYEASAGTPQNPLLSARLPGGASVWTPSGTSCLAPGGEYAWALRVVGRDADRDRESVWSEPARFAVASAPSREEVTTAIATLRRHLTTTSDSDVAPRQDDDYEPAGAESRLQPRTAPATTNPGAPRARELERQWRERQRLQEETDMTPDAQIAASAPDLGTPSVTVDASVALGAASNLFKDGSVFLWDDTAGNTALGRDALGSASGNSTNNTAIGWQALELTVEDGSPDDGSHGTAVGFRVLRNNTTGSANTASGSGAAYLNTEGDSNTAVGSRALFSNTTGSANTTVGAYGLYYNTEGFRNTTDGDITLGDNMMGSDNTGSGSFALMKTTGSGNTALGLGAMQNNTSGSGNAAIGYFAGLASTTGSDNVFVLSYGTPSDDGTIRVGTEGLQGATYVAGIRGTTTGVGDAVEVLVDSAGQLGTASSSRAVKQDIRDVEGLSRRLLDLRPVVFRYRDQVARDPEAPRQFGLIAEEVEAAFPELLVRDAEGRPQTVKYHLVPPLLLNELQRLDRTLGERSDELDALGHRLTALEESPSQERQKRTTPWWRRLFGARDGPG